MHKRGEKLRVLIRQGGRQFNSESIFSLSQVGVRQILCNGIGRLVCGVLKVLLLVLAVPGFADAELRNIDSPSRVPGAYHVMLKPEAELEKIRESTVGKPETLPDIRLGTRADLIEFAKAIAERADAEVSNIIETTRLRGFTLRGLSDEKMRELAKDSRIQFIEPVSKIREQTTQNDPPWHLDRIDQFGLSPLSDTYTYDSANAVLVIVLDSGVRYTHEQLLNTGALVRDCQAANIFTPCPIVGYNQPSAFVDCTGHGTNVVGVLSSRDHGVAKDVVVQGVIVTRSKNVASNCPAGDSDDLVRALNFFSDLKSEPANVDSPWVITTSIVADTTNSVLDDAASNAIDAGITVVAAAGNHSDDACDYSPGRVSEVIAVSASTSLDDKLDGANFGDCVDLFAPGFDIYTIGNASDTATHGPLNGTSLAAPIVAGIAALHLQTHRYDTPAEVQTAIVASATSGVLATTGLHAIGPGSPNKLAYSRVAPGSDTPPPGSIPAVPPYTKAERFLRSFSSILILLD